MLSVLAKFRVQLLLVALLLVGAVVMFFVASSIEEQEADKRRIRLQAIHEDAISEIRGSIDNFATLTSGIGSFIKYADEIPSSEKLQDYVNHLLKNLDYQDSIVVSFVDTNHVFRCSFTRSISNPQNLIGTSVRQFRNKEEIKMLEKIMKHEEMLLFEPFNLVEGWPGIAMNFGIKRDGVPVGYVAPVINLKQIVNNVYNEENKKEYVFRFTTSKGFDFSREAVFGDTPIYNKNKDLEFYQIFSVDTTVFIYSTINVFDLNIRVGTAYKEPYQKSGFLIMFLYSWYLILIVFSFITFRQMFQQHRLNVELKQAYEEIEEKSEDINASIRYARRIQEAIFPPEKLALRLLPDALILFKPKDVVSGDFYWIAEKENKVLVAAADCTGHGVPGAFMSVMGFTLLKQALEEHGVVQPAKILDDINAGMEEILGQNLEEPTIRDGMDIALCSIDFVNMKLEYAGAYNPLYLVRRGVANSEMVKSGKAISFGENLAEIKADKIPIGAFLDKEIKEFTHHEIRLEKDDTIYIFSDGYADQFGGPGVNKSASVEISVKANRKKPRKFKYKRFKELLIEIQDKTMKEQDQILNKTIADWQGDLDQIDDILVIGIRIS